MPETSGGNASRSGGDGGGLPQAEGTFGRSSGGRSSGGRSSGGSASGGRGGGTSSDGGSSSAPSTGGREADGSGAAPGGTGSSTAGGGEAGVGTGGQANSRSSCKRGVSYGYHSQADMAALSKGVSWWYNWAFEPDSMLRDGSYRDQQVEYVPMIWGAGSDRAAARDAIPDDARTLLGFNEPNFGEQANLSAVEAAALWPELESLAAERDLRLVSPAVNFCGGNCQETDPFRYLDEFFEACTGCRVDAVAIHIYVGCSPSGNNKAEWLINHIETYKSRFEQPLWLTEFACDSAANSDEQRAFLMDAVAYLEAEERIERYAWFAGRANNVPHVDLLGEDGELTELGQAYVDAPQDPACVR